MRKFHPDVGQEALMLRAGIHAMRRLMPEPTQLEKKFDRLQNRIRRLQSHSATNYQGRQQYVTQLIDLAKCKRQKAGLDGDGGASKRVFQRHMLTWCTMEPRQKAGFEHSAALERSARRRAVVEHINETARELDGVVKKLEVERSISHSVSMTSCKLSAADLDAIGELPGARGLRWDAVRALRDRARIAPLAPEQLIVATGDRELYHGEEMYDRPW
jgi:hypothetical protein